MTDPDRSDNPFFRTWETPDGVPPFDRIRAEHFREAYARAFAEHDAEIAAIASQPKPPTFANTSAALGAGRAQLDEEPVVGASTRERELGIFDRARRQARARLN